MNNPSGNKDSPIRRISKEEKARRGQGRAWPEKKHRASELDIPMPKPGQKNRIHSVLIALPVLMLVIGLSFYFRSEHKQNNGTPVLSELVTREAEFKSVSEVSGIGTPKHYLWYTNGETSHGVRITARQSDLLAGLNKGDAIKLEIAPRVAGSNTFWIYKVEHNNELIVDMSEDSQ